MKRFLIAVVAMALVVGGCATSHAPRVYKGPGIEKPTITAVRLEIKIWKLVGSGFSSESAENPRIDVKKIVRDKEVITELERDRAEKWTSVFRKAFCEKVEEKGIKIEEGATPKMTVNLFYRTQVLIMLPPLPIRFLMGSLVLTNETSEVEVVEIQDALGYAYGHPTLGPRRLGERMGEALANQLK